MDAAGWTTVVVVGGGAVLAAGRALWRIETIARDWRGEAGRPGVPERPGVMARLAGIEAGQAETVLRMDRFDTRLHGVEAQLTPNGGHSLHDRVTAIHEQTCGGSDG